jgi:monoamine oxidase
MSDLVVGAGLAGLYKAYNLLKDGHDVVILEKKNYVGGQLHTIKYEIENEVYFFDICYIGKEELCGRSITYNQI